MEVSRGTTPTTFEPERTCTRAQIVTFLYRHLVETGGTLQTANLPEPVDSPEAADDGAETTQDTGDSDETFTPEAATPEQSPGG